MLKFYSIKDTSYVSVNVLIKVLGPNIKTVPPVSQAIMNRQIPVFGLFEPYAEAEVRHFFNCSPLNDETIGKTERLHCAASIGSNDISFR